MTEEYTHESQEIRSTFWRTTWLAAGPLAALIVYWVVPNEYENASNVQVVLGHVGRATVAMMAWMAVWWLSEATDITVTALLPLGLFPLLNISTIEAAAAPYADKVVFLFMGGFILALSMQRWGLDRRLALFTLSLVGSRPANIVGGFMLVTAFISAFVSNVATTAMMLPIAMSVIGLLRRQDAASSANALSPEHRSFATSLSLSIAYAASVGGMATIIGTPPNAILVGFLESKVPAGSQMSITFLQWMMFGVPISAALLIVIWFLLTQIFFRMKEKVLEGGAGMFANRLRELGPINRGEWVTMSIFSITVAVWIFNPWLTKISVPWNGVDWEPLALLDNTVAVMIAVLFLFVIPASRENDRRCEFIMDWQTASRLPWNVLLLFGGGLSLAEAVRRNGVAEFLGSELSFLANYPEWAVVVVLVALMIFMGELSSNTASTASLLPVLIGLAPVIGIHPAVLAVAVTISASCSFMLPVATPPNAMVYASGQISISQMARVGFAINLISIVLVTLLVLYVVPLVLNV